MRYINYNGTIVEDKQLLTTDNRSFRYGDGLFESIRLTGGKIHLLKAHYQRMSEGLEYLKIKLPAEFDANYFYDAILGLLEKNDIQGEGRIRLTVFRDATGLYMPDGDGAGFLLEADTWLHRGFLLNEEGLTMGLFKEAHKPVQRLSNYKTNNCLVYVLAGMYKQEQGWDDAVILNARGHVAEAVSSNIFLVRDGVINTPALDEGCVAGVMRAHVLMLAKEAGYIAEETVVTQDGLKQADEMFLTNAIQGIRWVGACEGKSYVNDISLKLTHLLNKLLC